MHRLPWRSDWGTSVLRLLIGRPGLVTTIMTVVAFGGLALFLLTAGEQPERGTVLFALAVAALSVLAATATIQALIATAVTGSSTAQPATGARRGTAGREQLAAVLEHNADGVLAVDAAGSLRFLNGAARRLLEIGDADPLGLTWQGRSFVSVVRDHDLDGVLRRCRETGTQQTQAIQIGSRRRPVEAIFLPLRDAGEWRYLGLLHDLEEVRRAEGLRRDLVSNLSHELRTPLSSIRATVEVLLDGALEEPELAHEFIKAIELESDRLSQLVEEMLELSRIESGNIPFDVRPDDAAAICQEAARRMQAQAERAGVRLTCTVPDQMRPVLADHERLLRALLNLLHNAIKFTEAGGTVSVEASDRVGEAVLVVRDTGAGIASDDLDRIFERFYKADRARSSTGTGLGLAIVKHTVQAHRGRIEVESTPGVGSSFTLLLPYAE